MTPSIPKRKPGRPPKVPVTASLEKRRSGRPPKVPVTAPLEKRRPGRPPKVPDTPIAEKLSPGRPPKEPVTTLAKRRPGRPFKEKRRPGRPSKFPVTDPVEKRRPGRQPKAPVQERRPGRPPKAADLEKDWLRNEVQQLRDEFKMEVISLRKHYNLQLALVQNELGNIKAKTCALEETFSSQREQMQTLQRRLVEVEAPVGRKKM